MHVFIPLARANKTWAQDNPDCSYLTDMRKLNPKKKIKEFPLGISDAQYAKWVANSAQFCEEVLVL